MSVFSIVPASAAGSVTVGPISGTVIAGQTSPSRTYELTTSVLESSPPFPGINWYSDAITSVVNLAPPTGISISGTRITNGASTLTVNIEPNSLAGTYYFKVDVQSDLSPLVTLVVEPAPIVETPPVTPRPTITIGSASSSLTAGNAATPTYGVTTSLLLDGETLTILWVNPSTYQLMPNPTGITASVTEVSSNAATVTLNASNASTAGTYHFFALRGCCTGSNTVTLTVAADLSNGSGTPSADESAAIAAAAAAQAEIVRNQAIATSKKSLLQNIAENKMVTVSDLTSSDLQVSSAATAERVNAQIKATQAKNLGKVITIEVVQGIVKKEILVDRLVDSNTKQNVMATDLVEVGLIEATNPHKSSTIFALRKLPATSLDTFAKIESAVATYLASMQVKKDRLAKVKARLLMLRAG